jgi:hypothetical protein
VGLGTGPGQTLPMPITVTCPAHRPVEKYSRRLSVRILAPMDNGDASSTAPPRSRLRSRCGPVRGTSNSSGPASGVISAELPRGVAARRRHLRLRHLAGPAHFPGDRESPRRRRPQGGGRSRPARRIAPGGFPLAKWSQEAVVGISDVGCGLVVLEFLRRGWRSPALERGFVCFLGLLEDHLQSKLINLPPEGPSVAAGRWRTAYFRSRGSGAPAEALYSADQVVHPVLHGGNERPARSVLSSASVGAG